jgi:hypothetical protein
LVGTSSEAEPLAAAYCVNVDVDTCLDMIATGSAIADPPFVPGTAHVVLYLSDVSFACWCPVPLLVVEVSPNWKSYSNLRAWIVSVSHGDGPSPETFDASRLGDRVTRLPRGGPWLGNFVGGKLRVIFRPGTSRDDAGDIVGAFDLSVRPWTVSVTNGTEFDVPAGHEMDKLTEIAGDARVCVADLYRIDANFQLLPSSETDACVADGVYR